MRLLLSVIIIISFSHCSNGSEKGGYIEDKFEGYIPDSSVQYFPADSIFFDRGVNDASTDSFIKRWYSETLFNLHEPILYNYLGEGEAIRLLWLRSFGNPVSVRVSKFNDTVYANIKELNSDAQKIIMDTTELLDASFWNKMLTQLEINNFWNVNVNDSSFNKDGINWFLECRLNNKYRGINRWDDGSLSSADLNLYSNQLINLAARYTSMKSYK